MTSRVRWRVNVPAVTETGPPVMNKKGRPIPGAVRTVKEATTKIAEGYSIGPVVLGNKVHLVIQGLDGMYHVLPLDELNV